MSARPATQSTRRLGPQLGCRHGGWRRRIILHHLPLAVASALLLMLFVGLSPFTTGGYPALDMGAEGRSPSQSTQATG